MTAGIFLHIFPTEGLRLDVKGFLCLKAHGS